MEAFEEYKNVHDQMRLPDIKKTALLLSGDHWEYPLFNDVFRREILVSHIYVTNVSGRLPVLFNDPDCIVSTTFHDREIVYEGATFYNSTPKNKILWLYLKSSN